MHNSLRTQLNPAFVGSRPPLTVGHFLPFPYQLYDTDICGYQLAQGHVV